MSDDSGYGTNDVTLMDIWLVIRSYRRFALISVFISPVLLLKSGCVRIFFSNIIIQFLLKDNILI